MEKWYKKAGPYILGYVWGITSMIWVLDYFQAVPRLVVDMLYVQLGAVLTMVILFYRVSRDMQSERRKMFEDAAMVRDRLNQIGGGRSR